MPNEPQIKKSILVVEDETPLLLALQKKLVLSGFDVVVARSAKQALNALKDVGGVDFIWLDHMLLDDETGLDFLRVIKKDDKFKNIPVYVVSVTADKETIDEYMRLGATKNYAKHEFSISDIIKDIKLQNGL